MENTAESQKTRLMTDLVDRFPKTSMAETTSAACSRFAKKVNHCMIGKEDSLKPASAVYENRPTFHMTRFPAKPKPSIVTLMNATRLEVSCVARNKAQSGFLHEQ